MSDSEEEWITVRRRPGRRSELPRQLRKLAIPVVPLAFDALAEPEERPLQEDSKSKKKKKSKKAKAVDDGGEGEDGAVSGKGTPTASATRKTGGASDGSKSRSKTTAHMSFFAWLWSRLVAVLVMLGLMKAAGAGKKKRKSKATAQKVAEEPNRVAAAEEAALKPAAKQAVVDASGLKETEKAKPQASPANAVASAMATSPTAQAQQQQSQQQKKKPSEKAVTPPPAAATGPLVASKKQSEVHAPVAKAPAASMTPAEVKTAADTPLPTTAVDAKPDTTPLPKLPLAATNKPKAAPTAAEPLPPPQPPPATPPPPPAIKYDADWGRGKFVMQSLPTAHADVVSAVGLAGDVAVSAGYDGAVKLWHWPPRPGAPGGGVAPRLAMTRALVGHSGRVEALAAHAESRRLATSGRDSTLKMWDLGSELGGSGARELGSTYVYESVRSLAADWAGEGAASAGRVLLGARSGTVLLYSLGDGGAGRKLAALRGHEDEVTVLKFLYGSNGGGGGQVAVSGSRDGTVRLWDMRTTSSTATAVLTGLSGRVCSLEALGEHHLVAGDCSSTVKLWDLRQLPRSSAASRSPPSPPPRRLPNAPGFAGDSCPTAGLWHGPRSGVVLSSCIAWWTENKEALEEAPISAKLPMACLNVSAVGVPTRATSAGNGVDADAAPSLQCQYQYTVRLGPGVVTCMAGGAEEGLVLVGGASGALWALRLVRGGSAAAERAAAAVAATEAEAGSGGGGCEVVDALVVGAEEFSDDEYDDGNDDDE